MSYTIASGLLSGHNEYYGSQEDLAEGVQFELLQPEAFRPTQH